MEKPLTSGVMTSLLVKVAARCNIDCSYCYWFRDPSVYAKPKVMSPEITAQLLRRVEEHITRYVLTSFSVILHGGEPMLWGIPRFRDFAEDCLAITGRTGCAIPIALTTNGLLINDDWLDLFDAYDMSVTVSIDGPAHIHDQHRHTFKGGGTHAQAEAGIRRLQSRDIAHGALAVANLAHDPEEFVSYFTELGEAGFDVLFPDATWEDGTKGDAAAFYCRLFDLWMAANRERHVLSIRTIEEMVVGLLGGQSNSQGIGYGPIELCTVLTDGGMEPLDVLRIAGSASTETALNIFDNALEDIKTEPRWQAVRDASVHLCQTCRDCPFVQACGGGYLPHRYSKINGYDNPSVYCRDLFAIYSHIQSELGRHVVLRKAGGDQVNVHQAIGMDEARVA